MIIRGYFRRDRLIYLDNAATTWPKPEGVWQAVEELMKKGANPGRGGHRMALDVGRVVLETREAMAKIFNAPNPSRMVFTANATESLNLALKGFLKTGDHVLTTSMEHNAVARPLQVLMEQGVEVSYLPCSPEGFLDPQQIEKTIRKNTKMVVMTHASNVTGTIMPIEEVGQITRKNGLVYLVDAAQTAGVYDIDLEKLSIDLLAFPGHKGLLGPQGIGGLYIREGIDLRPLKEGGTGSNSESLFQPEVLPDKYESGTLNTLGIAGLGSGINFILEKGIKNIHLHEMALTKRLLEAMKGIKGIKIYGPNDEQRQAPVISFNFINQDSSEIGFILDRAFNIASRTGLHCAPLAHQTIGTLEQGTVRLSMSYFNTEDEIDYVAESLEKISSEQ